MYRKPFLINLLLVSGLAVTALILSAQVNKNDALKVKTGLTKESNVIQEPLLKEDNADGLDELDSLVLHYTRENLYLSGDIIFYPDKDSLWKSPETAQFTSIKTPLGSSYELDSVQTITNPAITLFIDKREKSIAVVEHDEAPEQPDFQKVISEELSQFRKYISSIKVTVQGKDKKLVITFKEDSPANINNYEIVYEPGSYRIKKVRMEIAGGEITDSSEDQDTDDELVFDDGNNHEIYTGYYAKVKTSVYEVIYKTEKYADADLVDISHVVQKGVNGYFPAWAYKNYEILN